MGGSSEPSGSQEDENIEVAERAKDAKESRESSFRSYSKQRDAAKKGIDISITAKEAETVRDNASIAMDFDAKAKESKINVPGTTGVALSTIQSINYSNIAAGLRGGGYAVTSSKDGSVQGVVNNGRYTGNLGFSPIGRSKGAFFNNVTQQYSVEQAQEPSGENDSQITNNTPSRTGSTVENKTDSTTTLSTASRRALISGGGGGAARRNLI
tara:strand:- start:30 stop:665 length:636 start_codon:yes stop_codon:yes gene_type:complete